MHRRIELDLGANWSRGCNKTARESERERTNKSIGRALTRQASSVGLSTPSKCTEREGVGSSTVQNIPLTHLVAGAAELVISLGSINEHVGYGGKEG